MKERGKTSAVDGRSDWSGVKLLTGVPMPMEEGGMVPSEPGMPVVFAVSAPLIVVKLSGLLMCVCWGEGCRDG